MDKYHFDEETKSVILDKSILSDENFKLSDKILENLGAPMVVTPKPETEGNTTRVTFPMFRGDVIYKIEVEGDIPKNITLHAENRTAKINLSVDELKSLFIPISFMSCCYSSMYITYDKSENTKNTKLKLHYSFINRSEFMKHTEKVFVHVKENIYIMFFKMVPHFVRVVPEGEKYHFRTIKDNKNVYFKII